MAVCLQFSGREKVIMLCVVLSINLFFNPLSAQIEPDFSQIKICQGDSFQLSNFLKYHVKVPVDYQLLGWKEGWLDWVAPAQTTSYHLQYAKKNGIGGVQEFSFLVQVIPSPTIDLEFSHTQLCEGSEIRVPHVYCYSQIFSQRKSLPIFQIFPINVITRIAINMRYSNFTSFTKLRM